MVKNSDLWKDIILNYLTKARRSLSISGIANKTLMEWLTAKKKLLELEKEGRVRRDGKKWIVNN